MAVILKIDGRYLEWSIVADGPLTDAMTREEFEAYYRAEYGNRAMEEEFPRRMKRVEEKGTSSMLDDSARETVQCNRAGPNESELTFDELRAMLSPRL